MTSLKDLGSLPVVGTGVIGNRDPENPCEDYNPLPRVLSERPAECLSDGHYLCKGCKWFDREGRRLAVGGDW